ncbi:MULTISPECIES: nicotinate-nucleotide--dimethylbenzimidazole phosphoribosyltransferase [Methylomonas]|uniref:nicotinate-nucleotide--dimethylbenzimidazole phosphoribosyltransferase n=1 Tax=Methylomonas TaxID=416 RepID=UPI001231C1AF|nr:nicotinate-nucleotide--dimethylbenzimidazole phosphoribosyltransferase [Methylomonas rhizoryzae]
MYGYSQIIAPVEASGLQRAQDRQNQLTKPAGSLGKLEALAVRAAAMQNTDKPGFDNIRVSVFAADHGIAAEGVSAFPQAVTAQMVKNFAAGGAAVNALSRYLAAGFEVVDVGLLEPVDLPQVLACRAGCGTRNFKVEPAMSEAQLQVALQAGRDAVGRALAHRAQLFVGGEMGIANTASASAIAAALLNLPAAEITGAGTGLSSAQIRHKAQVIEHALVLHRPALTDAWQVLRCVGGFEIAALTAAYLEAASARLPVMVDGFISSVAALSAATIQPVCKDWFFYGHRSAEKGHHTVLNALSAEPILDLGMRLGEASGALAAVPVLQMACRLHGEMATFTQANITTG